MPDLFHLDTGTEIHLDCKVDVSGASAKKMMIKKPSGTIVEVDAAQGDDDNNIKYTIPSSDSPFDEDGRFILRSKITFSGSQTQQGDPVVLMVGESWTAS